MSTCGAGKLCTVVAHKLSVCCGWFDFVFGVWNMHFNLGLGLFLVFGVRFGFWVGFAFGVWLGFSMHSRERIGCCGKLVASVAHKFSNAS